MGRAGGAAARTRWSRRSNRRRGMAETVSGVAVTPIHPCLGARVEGVDLAGPLDEVTFQRIFDAFQEYSVLVFQDQRLTDEQQMTFSRRFGPLETTINSIGQERRLHPNLVDLSNVDPRRDGRLMGWDDRRMLYQSGNQLWHTDSSFKPVPAMASLLSGREVPAVGGVLDELLAHTTRPEHVYQHRWHAWDLVMWDNRCVLHRGRPWDATLHRRVMRRTTVAGEGPTADPPFASRSVAWDGIIPEGVGVQRPLDLG